MIPYSKEKGFIPHVKSATSYSGASCRRSLSVGFTLVEMLVYVGIVSVVFMLTVTLMIQLMRTYTRFRVEREISTNVREAVNYMIREIKSAEDIYVPTSALGSHPGQISLETRLNMPADETSTFIDFYMDNGKLLIKREGQNPFPLLSDRVEVKNLVFRHFDPAGLAELLQIDLTLGYREGTSRFEFQVEKTLVSSASIRGAY